VTRLATRLWSEAFEDIPGDRWYPLGKTPSLQISISKREDASLERDGLPVNLHLKAGGTYRSKGVLVCQAQDYDQPDDPNSLTIEAGLHWDRVKRPWHQYPKRRSRVLLEIEGLHAAIREAYQLGQSAVQTEYTRHERWLLFRERKRLWFVGLGALVGTINTLLVVWAIWTWAL